jgi:hypothetical protein
MAGAICQTDGPAGSEASDGHAGIADSADGPDADGHAPDADGGDTDAGDAGDTSDGQAASDSGLDGAGGRPPDTCAEPANCPGGTCWLQLDGSKSCVAKVKVAAESTCQGVPTICCMADTSCTAQVGGLCVPNRFVTTTFCGGAQPIGNVCRYDECANDADCDGAKPAGATKSACFPPGVYAGHNLFTATCVYGACRTDDDCTQSAGGRCSYGLAPTHGVCNLQYVTYCSYPSDPCHLGNVSSSQCDSAASMTCVPQDDLQGLHCGPAPPTAP